MIQTAQYSAPWWLTNAHAQTIYGSLYARKPDVAYRRERWVTFDHDFVDIDFVDADASPRTPHVHLFHGLEGSSQSGYARALMHAVRALGWSGSVLNWRGCSGEPNKTVRAYHSGDSAEVNWVLHKLKARIGDRPLIACGVSLGGNALLKWTGEQGVAAKQIVQAVTGVCAPMDLAAGGAALEKGFAKVYAKHFLSTMKVMALTKLTRAGETSGARVDAIRKAKTLREFDNWYTAPIHGYIDTNDYWYRASAKHVLRCIDVPTLILCAKDDPIVPAYSLPTLADVSRKVTLEYAERGGHVGFVSGAFPGDVSWLANRLVAYFKQAL
jgi:uncharacterized protein